MEDIIEKVIKGLECCRIDENRHINCADCPYYTDDDKGQMWCSNEINNDALKLLKSQQAEIKRLEEAAQPRVMDFTEVYNLEPELYFIEFRGCLAIEVAHADRNSIVWLCDFQPKARTVFIGEHHVVVVENASYEKRWRCWTARPTMEQRNAEPWKEVWQE